MESPSPVPSPCRKERIEDLFLHLGWNAGAIVTDRYFNPVAEAPRPGGKRGLVVAAIGFRPAFGRCVEAIRNQIEQNPCDVLREDIDLSGSRVKGRNS